MYITHNFVSVNYFKAYLFTSIRICLSVSAAVIHRVILCVRYDAPHFQGGGTKHYTFPITLCTYTTFPGISQCPGIDWMDVSMSFWLRNFVGCCSCAVGCLWCCICVMAWIADCESVNMTILFTHGRLGLSQSLEMVCKAERIAFSSAS